MAARFFCLVRTEQCCADADRGHSASAKSKELPRSNVGSTNEKGETKKQCPKSSLDNWQGVRGGWVGEAKPTKKGSAALACEERSPGNAPAPGMSTAASDKQCTRRASQAPSWACTCTRRHRRGVPRWRAHLARTFPCLKNWAPEAQPSEVAARLPSQSAGSEARSVGC